MFDWATDFDLGAFVDSCPSTDLKRHFLLGDALLNKRLIGRQDFGRKLVNDPRTGRGGGTAAAADCGRRTDGWNRSFVRCCCRREQEEINGRLLGRRFRCLGVASVIASLNCRRARTHSIGIARLGFRRSRCRVALVSRLSDELAERQQLLARHFAHSEPALARRRTLRQSITNYFIITIIIFPF